MVVDDEMAIRDVAHRVLTCAGYQVTTTADGQEALALLADVAVPADLLLTDVVMPGMLGKEVAEHVRAARPGTRVLYMSGYAQPVLASRGTLDEGVSLIEKPFSRAALLDRVREALGS
jgi:CheY-like chemotaxis protein